MRLQRARERRALPLGASDPPAPTSWRSVQLGVELWPHTWRRVTEQWEHSAGSPCLATGRRPAGEASALGVAGGEGLGRDWHWNRGLGEADGLPSAVGVLQSTEGTKGTKSRGLGLAAGLPPGSLASVLWLRLGPPSDPLPGLRRAEGRPASQRRDCGSRHRAQALPYSHCVSGSWLMPAANAGPPPASSPLAIAPSCLLPPRLHPRTPSPRLGLSPLA